MLNLPACMSRLAMSCTPCISLDEHRYRPQPTPHVASRSPAGPYASWELEMIPVNAQQIMPEHRLYRLQYHEDQYHQDAMNAEGPFQSEAKVLDALREINRRSAVSYGEISVHVYSLHPHDDGEGRRYLGPIDATAVLDAEEVNEDHLLG